MNECEIMHGHDIDEVKLNHITQNIKKRKMPCC